MASKSFGTHIDLPAEIAEMEKSIQQSLDFKLSEIQ